MKGDLFGFHFELDERGFRYRTDRDRRVNLPWTVIVLGFVVFWPLGLGLMFLQLRQEEKDKAGDWEQTWQENGEETYTGGIPFEKTSAASGDDSSARQGYYRTQSCGQEGASDARSGQKYGSNASSAREKGGKNHLYRKIKSGTGAIITGSILTGVFGLGFLSVLLAKWHFLWGDSLWFLAAAIPLFLFTGVSAGILTMGLSWRKRAKKYRRYLSLIGTREQVSLRALADAYPTTLSAAAAAVQRMIDEGIFGAGAYLDRNRGILFLDGRGVRDEEEEKTSRTTDEEESWLRQIRQVNEAISHPELSRKIDRIGEITQNILAYQREHPEKAAELRKFLRYYLPTTLKILNAYAEMEKQSVEGENIAATKRRIEGMMDMVVEGFERQLDRLFAGDMMDISADITVMEKMMQGDGLFTESQSSLKI